MIGRVLDLRSVKVGELAIPMAKVVTVDAGAPLSEVLALARERRVTRLPVWEAAGGKRPGRRIAGMISLKRLLYQQDLNPERKAAEFLKSALFLTEESRADEALQRMRRTGQRLAIVLGSGRREVGVVGLEDLLRYMFGEVRV
jgi:CBS domain containing-hemolysin-like protein